MKRLIAVWFLAAAFAVQASEDEELAYTGGTYVKPASGMVMLLDAQSRVPNDALAASVKEFVTGFKLPSKTVKTDAKFSLADAGKLKKENNATVIVFLTDDPTLPMVLAAPEASWAVANVAAVASGNPDAELLKTRTCKIVRRALILALGGSFAPDGKLVCAPVRSIADLDSIKDSGVVIDQMFGIVANARELGLSLEKKMTYRDACEKGIAPQPTNAVQRAVWDEVNAVPDKPIKIKKRK